MYPVGPLWVAAFDHTDRKEKRHSMHVAALNPDGFWLGPAREAHFRKYDKYENRTYEVFTSADSTRLVGHLAGPFGKEELAEHALVVLDADLEPLYTRELVLPYSNDQLRVGDLLLDTQGNIHLYAAQPRPKVRLDSQRALEERKNHTLFSYYWKSNTLKELEIDLQTQWITDARVAFTPGGAIGVAGLYSNGPYFRTKGIFGLVLEPVSRRILSQGLVQLPKETIDGFSSRRRSDGGREITNLYLDHALFPTDTTWTLVAEQFEVVERVSTDPATGRKSLPIPTVTRTSWWPPAGPTTHCWAPPKCASRKPSPWTPNGTRATPASPVMAGSPCFSMTIQTTAHWTAMPAHWWGCEKCLSGVWMWPAPARKIAPKWTSWAKTDPTFDQSYSWNWAPVAQSSLGNTSAPTASAFWIFEIPATFWRPTRRTFAIPFTNCGPATLFERHGHDPHGTRY